MKWFLVTYIYQIISGTGTDQHQFDEQLRLIVAADFAGAFDKAGKLADGFNPAFMNLNDEWVSWKFIGIADLTQIQQPADGTEVCSALHEPEDPKAFLNRIELRKLFLQQRMPYKKDTIKNSPL